MLNLLHFFRSASSADDRFPLPLRSRVEPNGGRPAVLTTVAQRHQERQMSRLAAMIAAFGLLVAASIVPMLASSTAGLAQTQVTTADSHDAYAEGTKKKATKKKAKKAK